MHDGIGNDDRFLGGDLTFVGRRRTARFLTGWLRDPASWNRYHRMPQFALEPDEIDALVAFFSSARSTERPRGDWLEMPDQRSRGRELFARYRCGACHETSDPRQPVQVASLLDEATDWDAGCLRESGRSRQRSDETSPVFQLTDIERQSIAAFYRRPNRSRLPRRVDDDLQRVGCTACHVRGESGGMSQHLDQLVARWPDYGPRLAAMSPPVLNHVGRKLRRASMQQVVRGDLRVRPYLAARMPHFAHLGHDDIERLVDRLIAEDRLVEQIDDETPFHDARVASTITSSVGPRLLGPEGFGCASCHDIGTSEPSPDSPRGRGPQLLGIDRRIRPSWFVRWLANPARFVPRMEMPAVKVAVPGVLDNHLPTQISALWQAMQDVEMRLPAPRPYRRLRENDVALQDHAGRASVVTDVLHHRERLYIKPMLVGLPNRHNVLFDAQHASIAAWWTGDVADLVPIKKTWAWYATQPSLLPATSGQPELRLARGRHHLIPLRQGQFDCQLDGWHHVARGVVWRYRVAFLLPGGERSVVHVVDGVEPIPNGWRRRVNVAGVPEKWRAELRLPAHAASSDAHRSRWRVEIGSGSSPQGTETASQWIGGDGPQWEIDYTASLPVDFFPVEPPPPAKSKSERLRLGRGIVATRLPFVQKILPSAITVNEAGHVVVGSLDGRVWVGRDTDGDRVDDQLDCWSDELPTPYGLSARGRSIDVVTKMGLLRLTDNDGDHFAEHVESLVSGWGHTDDYHDWSVGLPRDEMGNYYVATACQQDDRSFAATKWRGKVLRLVPREPTKDDPQRYAIEQMTEGHRFPMGIALSPDGMLFVTDNQGHFNPFNELNRVVSGRHYGFINAIDRGKETPELTPPAVNIPHPWTRSVNGIAYLAK